MNAYFDTLSSFIKLFFVFTLINLAIVLVYRSYDGMKSLSGVTITASSSIGNLGFSTALCSPVSFGVGNNVIGCPYGTVQNIISYGVLPKVDKGPGNSTDEMEIDFRANKNKGV